MLSIFRGKDRHIQGEMMANEQRLFGTRRGVRPHASRRGLLHAGLAIGTLALGLGRRAAIALGQSHEQSHALPFDAPLCVHVAEADDAHAHMHMPELGVANLPVVPAMDQPLIEPEVRRSANGVLSTSLRCAYAYRDIGGTRLYLRSYEGGLAQMSR